MEILAGLPILGNIINTKNNNNFESNKIIKKTNRNISDRSNNKNIYTSKNLKRTRNKIETLAERRTAQSKIPSKTGVIPKF